MRKFNTRLFASLLAVFCCMTALSATAYADGGYYEQSEDGSETPPSSIDSITISTESVKLPEQQGSILHAQYEDGATLRQISDKLGLEYQRTRQERDKALRELRKPHNSHKLEYFLPDRALSMAFGGGVESYNRKWTSSTERAAFEDLGW